MLLEWMPPLKLDSKHHLQVSALYRIVLEGEGFPISVYNCTPLGTSKMSRRDSCAVIPSQNFPCLNGSDNDPPRLAAFGVLRKGLPAAMEQGPFHKPPNPAVPIGPAAKAFLPSRWIGPQPFFGGCCMSRPMVWTLPQPFHMMHQSMQHLCVKSTSSTCQKCIKSFAS